MMMKKKNQGTNSLHCNASLCDGIANLQCTSMSLSTVTVPAAPGRRTNERERRRAQTKNKTKAHSVCDAKQGPFLFLLLLLLLRGSINKNNPLTSTFLLMSSRSTAQVIFTHTPETSLHCTLLSSPLPEFLGSVAGWTVAADFLQANETAVATQRNGQQQHIITITLLLPLLQLLHFFTHYCTVLCCTQLN